MNKSIRFNQIELTLILFKEHITSLIEGDPETYNLEELRGKNLGCWCHPPYKKYNIHYYMIIIFLKLKILYIYINNI